MATKTVLSRSALFLVGDCLRLHCVRADKAGIAVYEEGWDDERIVTEFRDRFPITLANVRGLREDLVGHLRRGGDQGGDAPRFKELERRLAELERWAAARPVQPFAEDWESNPGKKGGG